MKFIHSVAVVSLIICGALAVGVTNSVAQIVHSHYLAMRDGTRIAVDIWLPQQQSDTIRVPAIIQFTRYWRASLSNPKRVTPEVSYFTSAGYAVVVADVRGTGASFGTRDTEFSDKEVADYGQIIDWLAVQPWSNGRVATLGTSYLGNAAELAAIPARPALRALVPRFTDFSEYRNAIRPGGVLNSVIAKAWIATTSALDRNDACGTFLDPRTCGARDRWQAGVKPVDGDMGLLKQAIGEHARNVDLAPVVNRLIYSNDLFSAASRARVTLDDVSPSHRWPAIDRARIPAFHWASWFDGGTAEGVLIRFMTYKTPINVIIGAWNHGGTSNANPYEGHQGSGPPDPPVAAQFGEIRRFLDPLLKIGLRESPVPMGQIRYFTVGENRWHTSMSWPPSNVGNQRWYFSADNALETAAPKSRSGEDHYRVNFKATTGEHNRWHTQLGTYVNYPDRREEDRKLFTYTSPPFLKDTILTGTPAIHVEMTSTTADGALFAYLEDVAPDGRVIYLAEGGIRLLFNGKAPKLADVHYSGPLHTYSKVEAHPFELNRPGILEFSLSPISVRISAGHRIRIAIAGADAQTFERLPDDGTTPVFSIQRSMIHMSYVDLPFVRSDLPQ